MTISKAKVFYFGFFVSKFQIQKTNLFRKAKSAEPKVPPIPNKKC